MQAQSLTLAGWLIIVTLAAVLGSTFEAGAWYALLVQPGWGPPRWLLAIGWPACFLLLGLAAWRAGWYAGAGLGRFQLAWAAALVLLVGWFWLLLEQHRPGWALAALGLALVLMTGAALGLRGAAAVARVLMLPCLAWLAYLWAWNFVVWRLNGGGVDSLLG